MIVLLGTVLSMGCSDKSSDEPDVEPSPDRYQEGYDDGYEDGVTAGYDSGQQDGFEDGYSSGQQDGFEDGYDSGYAEGYDSGYENGSEDGYNNGYEDGVNDSTPLPGWDLYANGEYAAACESFFYEASQTGMNADNAIGLGWCHLRQAEALLAASWFEMAVAIDASSQDGWAGLSSAALMMHDFELVAHAVDQTLTLNPTYTCSFEAIDETSLQVAQILALLFTQDTAGVSIFLTDLDPNHGLVALDSSSWNVDAIAYTSFQHAVIAKLHSLGGI